MVDFRDLGVQELGRSLEGKADLLSSVEMGIAELLL